MSKQRFLLTDKIVPRKTKVIGVAYVAPWQDGTLGWVVPRHITHKRIERPCASNGAEFAEGEWTYRCRITIELLPDKRGRIRRLRVKP